MTSIALWLLAGFPSVASMANAEEDGDVFVIEEIIVSAQKRAERLQDVPIAIDAFGSDMIDALGINELQDLSEQSPGVFFKNLDVAQPQVFIRGIGTVQFDASSEQPVGIFIDEVYVARHTASTGSLYDIERIEVLKGPQGTLYGRNTIGGAINVVTRAPSDEFEGYGEVELGRFNMFNFSGAVSGPLIKDKLSARVAFSSRDRDGWTRNAVTGNYNNDENSNAIRAKLHYTPNDALEIDLSADYSKDRLAGLNQELKGTQSFPFAAPQTELTPDDPFTAHHSIDGFFNRNVWGMSGRVTYNMEDISITSITAYREHDLEAARDLDAGPAALLDIREFEKGNQFSQELRIASEYADSKINWLAGLFYFKEKADRTEIWPLASLLDITLPDFFAKSIGIVPNSTAVPAFFSTQDFQGDYSWRLDNENKNFAAFGQVSFNIIDQVTITGGLRYSYEKKKGTHYIGTDAAVPFAAFVNPGPGWTGGPVSLVVPVAKDWSSLDPSVTIDFRPFEDALFYASYKKGFKSGGFQHRPADAALAATPYDPESVEVYELGAKTQWFDRRLQLNASGFMYDYTNLQLLSLKPGSIVTFTDNVAAASIDGFELEAVAYPLAGVMLTAGYSYLDATYDRFIDSSGIDRAGQNLPRVPKNTFNATAQYSFDVGDIGIMTIRGEYSWRDEIFFLPDNAEPNRDGPVSLFNASITFESPDERWKLSLWGKNLTDKVYAGNQIINVPSTSAATVI
jgi:iron complex outermembrane receptor protein